MASVCDYLAHKTWGPWKNFNPIEELHKNGMEWVRAWVTTISSEDLSIPYEKWKYLPIFEDEYWSCREYTAQILKEAAQDGMRLDLILFLSDRAAHAGWQYAPKGWENYSIQETASALESSCYEIADYYKSLGLDIEIYEMGNEIESGICGYFPGLPGGRIPYPKGIDKFSPEGVRWWKENIWNIEATLLKSAIKGAKKANPSAKILLHTNSVNAHPALGGSVWSEKNLFSIGFFQSMIEYGVEFDYVGLSYYPSANFIPTKNYVPIFDELKDVIDSIATITGKKIYISEFSYSGNRPGVQFERPGYPFTEKGQADCIADFLQWMATNINVKGVAYWYPDRFPGMSKEAPNEDSFGLFASETEIRPALLEFKKASINYRHTLTLGATTGGITIPRPGISAHPEGAILNIGAAASIHYRFDRWTGNVPMGHETDNPLSLTMDSDKSLTANFLRIIYAPMDFIGQKVLNRSLSQAEYINVLSWSQNPNNEGIVGYRIRQKEANSMKLIAEFTNPVKKYVVRNVGKNMVYEYSIVAVNNENREGESAYAIIR